MKKLLSTFLALAIFIVSAQAQTKKPTTAVIHKPISHFTDGSMDVKSSKTKVATTAVTHKPTNNLGGQEVGRKPVTKTSTKHNK